MDGVQSEAPAGVAAGADAGLTAGYDLGGFFDEMFEAPGRPRAHYRQLFESLAALMPATLEERSRVASSFFLTQGITFTVYGDEEGTERIFPFDLVPRIMPARRVGTDRARARAAHQRAQPLPPRRLPRAAASCATASCRAELVFGCAALPARDDAASDVPGEIYTHVGGTDLVRDSDGRYLVLEDNCARPSGVSYMLENRKVMKRVFPQLFERYGVRADRGLPARAAGDPALGRAARPAATRPSCCSTPGHLQLGLLRAHVPGPADGHRAGRGPRPGRDDNRVFMRTTRGPASGST